ncbi:uncharacterized protein LOC124945811 [Impatiens glandulifera]|uniref:uncharacterized protein LOC124945811 n=1 Tax=Impatiens glandulifera TaxID=253017 RepID=UPI001FB09070|nr:uncharacterized protein LOC124945811 [Impatiens glandulifera]
MADNYLDSYEGSYYGTGPYIYSSNSEIVVPFEDPICYSYELNPDLNHVNHYPPPYDNLISTQSEISYSAHRFSEPNLIQYYPISHSYLTNHLYYSETQIETDHHIVPAADTVVMVQAADDDDFLEYDPTPYGGGYDQILTYGEPLQASNKICHPRSTITEPIHDFSYNNSSNIPSPYGGQDCKNLQSLEKPKREDTKPDIKPLYIHDQEEKPSEIVAEKPLNLGKESDYNRQYEYGGQVAQFPPYGYGLEAIDLCEGLFGYWPCLSKELRTKAQEKEAEQEEYDQYWSCAQDFIFGSSTPYGYGETN